MEKAQNKLTNKQQQLTSKQEKFIIAYIETGNATRAAQLAGYGNKKQSCATIGAHNLRLPAVKQRIASLVAPDNAAHKAMEKAQRVSDRQTVLNTLSNAQQAVITKHAKTNKKVEVTDTTLQTDKQTDNALQVVYGSGAEGNGVNSAQRETAQRALGMVATRREREAFWTQIMRGKKYEVVNGSVVEVLVSVSDRLRASELLAKAQFDFTDDTQHSAPGGAKLGAVLQLNYYPNAQVLQLLDATQRDTQRRTVALQTGENGQTDNG